MKKVFFLTLLLIIGLGLSQTIPFILPNYSVVSYLIKVVTLVCLSFIMVYAGYELKFERSRLKEYGKDYMVALISAALPWIFVTLYFMYVFLPEEIGNPDTWNKIILTARFASPTSTGILISMLAAAGLTTTWMYRKTKRLAILDDLDTVLLIIPLQILKMGVNYQLFVVIGIMIAAIILVIRFHNTLNLKLSWLNVFIVSAIITILVELVYLSSKELNDLATVHIEVLFPAFAFGALISKKYNEKIENGRAIDYTETIKAKKISYFVSCVFMLFVGFSMPLFPGLIWDSGKTLSIDSDILRSYLNNADLSLLPSGAINVSLWILFFNALAIALLSNLGKLFPAFLYRKQATFRERLAVAIAMFPRGEIGAGKLIIALSYGISSIIISVAMLSLIINMVLMGVFIYIVKLLLGEEKSLIN